MGVPLPGPMLPLLGVGVGAPPGADMMSVFHRGLGLVCRQSNLARIKQRTPGEEGMES
jgi:hypothetical protein